MTEDPMTPERLDALLAQYEEWNRRSMVKPDGTMVRFPAFPKLEDALALARDCKRLRTQGYERSPDMADEAEARAVDERVKELEQKLEHLEGVKNDAVTILAEVRGECFRLRKKVVDERAGRIRSIRVRDIADGVHRPEDYKQTPEEEAADQLKKEEADNA